MRRVINIKYGGVECSVFEENGIQGEAKVESYPKQLSGIEKSKKGRVKNG